MICENAGWAEYAKDIAAFVGTVVAAVPFYLDYRIRHRLVTTDPAKTGDRPAAAILAAASGFFRSVGEAPSKSGLHLTWAGLLLVFLSLLLSLGVTYANRNCPSPGTGYPSSGSP